MDEIDIIENVYKEDNDSQAELPVNFLSIGSAGGGSVQVYIKQDVFLELEKLSKHDTEKEVGSILLGTHVRHGDKTYVIISNFIEAEYTEATAATLTFTHKTWEHIHKNRELMYSDKKIVGWHHTHPGYGIFLSNYDLFIQENYFNLEWQVAYVVDPVANTRGFFDWEKGKVTRMTGFYIYDDIENKIGACKENIEVEKKGSGMFNIIMSIALVIMTILTISLQIEKNNMCKMLEAAMSKNPDENIKSSEIILKEDIRKFNIYIVKADDTLEKICETNNLDYMENLKTIMKVNGISDEDLIYAGQELLLPIVE